MPLCRAHSSRTGEPCKKRAVIGATVCATHGASASQVRAAANARIMELVAPALAVSAKVMREYNKRDRDVQQAVAVHKDILDRAGIGEKLATKVELEVTGDAKFDFTGFTTEQLTSIAALLDAAIVKDGDSGPEAEQVEGILS